MDVVIITNDGLLKKGVEILLSEINKNAYQKGALLITDIESFLSVKENMADFSGCIVFYKYESDLHLLNILPQKSHVCYLPVTASLDNVRKEIRQFVRAVSKRKADSIIEMPAAISLSGQELKVLRLYLSGATANEIARILRIKIKSVLNYRKNGFNKLRLRQGARNIRLLDNFLGHESLRHCFSIKGRVW